MELFPLPIFPQGSLRESVITTVWLGVFVISFFNLRFGWTYSGLVIPGYLVPLLLVNPLSAVTTVVEGILAYGVVRFFSDYLSRFGLWCNFFGRDRFFALFLASVATRVVMDGWILPAVGAWVQATWHVSFDFRGSLHSFGMIIVALIANQFWKPGVRRGLVPFLTTLGLTFLLTRYGLMVLTNFNVGNVAYMYSDTAASLLASPKAYIILITTGFIASRMNLEYGWEFNGILIPALLALQWYEPLKILSSFVEAAVIYLFADLALRLPLFKNITMEGARKVLLFFNIAYLYRFALGYLLPWLMPGIIVTDYYGFAYLLSSLIAIKMHSKQISIRLTRTTLQTSLIAAVIANIAGLALASLFGSLNLAGPKPAAQLIEPLAVNTTNIIDRVRHDKVRLFEKRIPNSVLPAMPAEVNVFSDAVQAIRTYLETKDPELLDRGRRYLQQVNYTVELVDNRYLYLHEKEPHRGWGIYVVDTQTPAGVLIEVPAPLDEWAVMESGAWLFSSLRGGALAISGSARAVNQDGSSDVLLNPNTFFQAFHKAMSRRNVLQVRGYTLENVRQLSGLRPEDNAALPVMKTTLWVKSELPPGLSLAALKTTLGELQLEWRPTPLRNRQQAATVSGFAELWLDRDARIDLQTRPLRESFRLTPSLHNQYISGYLQEWLLETKGEIAESGSNAYRPPRPEELLFFDEEILTPLLTVARTEYRQGIFSEYGVKVLRSINATAALLGYRAIWYRHQKTQQDYLILAEAASASERRYWGTYVFRLGPNRPYLIQIPRPMFDLNTFEYGVFFFDRLQAEALLIAGAHRDANEDGAANVLSFRNQGNLFSLVNQVLLREAGDQPQMVIHCRGFTLDASDPLPADVVLAFQNGITSKELLTPMASELYQLLEGDRLFVKFVDGSRATAGYELTRIPQALYLNQAHNKEFAVIWLSPLVRLSFRQQTENNLLNAQFKALRVETVEVDLEEYLLARLAQGSPTQVPPALKEAVNLYLASYDLVALQKAMLGWNQFHFVRLLDVNSRQAFLLIGSRPNVLPVVANLSPRAPVDAPGVGDRAMEPNERIKHFINSGTAWLEWPD